MDLLCRRYASPFLFVNEMLKVGRFAEFVDNLIKTDNKEKEEKAVWEYYLSARMQFYEGSFEDFKEGLKNNRDNANMTAKDIETTVNHSMKILNNFNPEKG